jgi:hypothetical protein
MTLDSEQLLAVITERINAAHEEIARLQAARAALQHTSRPPATGAASERSRSSRNHRRAARRSSRAARRRGVLDPERLIDLLAADDEGMSATAIAKRTNVSTAQVSARLRELQGANRVFATGDRRTRRWRQLTDEDRIARTVELERASAGQSPASG